MSEKYDSMMIEYNAYHMEGMLLHFCLAHTLFVVLRTMHGTIEVSLIVKVFYSLNWTRVRALRIVNLKPPENDK